MALNGPGIGPITATYNATAAAIPCPEEKRPSSVAAAGGGGKDEFQKMRTKRSAASKRFHTR